MILVISDSEFLPGEAASINELFRAGLDLFHIRKYHASEEELSHFIRSIDAVFHPQLVLNHHHNLGVKLGLKRFHFSERDRDHWEESGWAGKNPEWSYSTSVHTMEEYNALPDHFSYAFLSPVFDSISKPGYQAVRFDFDQKKESPVKLIGLGGIQAENVSETIQMGFDGAALLGAIWNSEQPVDSFKDIASELRKKVLKQ